MELDAAISSSMELSESSDDPASAEVLRCLLTTLTVFECRLPFRSIHHMLSLRMMCCSPTPPALAPLLLGRMALKSIRASIDVCSLISLCIRHAGVGSGSGGRRRSVKGTCAVEGS